MTRRRAKTAPARAQVVAETPAPAPIVKASDAKIRANRRNAALSTGPRTPEGKRIARWNATRHGLLSAAVVLPDESEADFRALRDHLRADLQPVGAVEELLCDRLVSLAWRLRRLGRVEGEILRWARAEAERARHEHLSRKVWQDETRRADEAARGVSRFFEYEETHSPSGRKLRKPRKRTVLCPVPAVGRMEYLSEAISVGEATKRQEGEVGKRNREEAMRCLVGGACQAAEEADEARKLERYERDGEGTILARAFMTPAAEGALDRLGRYETTAERAFGRVLDRLLALQATRGAGGLVLNAEPEREPRG